MRIAVSLSALTLALAAAACSGALGKEQEAQSKPETIASAAPEAVSPPIQAADDYYIAAAKLTDEKIRTRTLQPAKNVILFVGDGMGVSTITAGRIYAGQKRGQDGESHRLAMEMLPATALSKTYSHDFQVPDSASTATALTAGVKTGSRVLGLRATSPYGNCARQADGRTDSLFDLAERAGRATGIVSTARVTHATPAAAYSESASRNWEDDTDVGGDENGGECSDIARQLIEWAEGDGLEIALGGGRRHFTTIDQADPERLERTGRRADGRDLTAEWTQKSDQHTYITDKAGFDSIDFASGTRVLGLFEPSHMKYELDRAGDEAGEPSIEEMTRAAITRLSQDEDGYVLLVEGGRIDHGHHEVNAARALEDVDAFDQAIKAAMEMTDVKETLIVVTADHSHTLTIAGYPKRNNPILGKSILPVSNEPNRGTDGMPYTTLSYANGQSACRQDGDELDCTRRDLTDVDTTDPDFRQPVLVPLFSETHAGEDVAVFARGPGAHLVSGVMEQNEIFHIMARSAGLVPPPE